MQFASPQAAQKLGITAVYQELSLIPDMTVADGFSYREQELYCGDVRVADIVRETGTPLYLYNLDDLARIANENLRNRKREVDNCLEELTRKAGFTWQAIKL